MTSRFSWRPNDIVAYDEMRDSANRLVAILLRRIRTGASEGVASRAEIDAVRRRAVDVDGFDRASVDALRQEFERRAAALSRASK